MPLNQVNHPFLHSILQVSRTVSLVAFLGMLAILLILGSITGVTIALTLIFLPLLILFYFISRSLKHRTDLKITTLVNQHSANTFDPAIEPTVAVQALRDQKSALEKTKKTFSQLQKDSISASILLLVACVPLLGPLFILLFIFLVCYSDS